jgi:hypothetical protein
MHSFALLHPHWGQGKCLQLDSQSPICRNRGREMDIRLILISEISGKNVVLPGAGWRKSSELNKWNMKRHEQDLQLLPNTARRRQKSCAQHVGASHNPRPGLRKIGQPGVYHLVNIYCTISKKQVLLLCMAPRKHGPLVSVPKK